MPTVSKVPAIEVLDEIVLSQADAVIKLKVKADRIEKEEKEAKTELFPLVENLREKHVAEERYYGYYNMTTNSGSIRCEYRIAKGCIDSEQAKDIDKLFGSRQYMLFERQKVVTTITDPMKLIKDLGPEAWQHLELTIKEDHDAIVIERSGAVSYKEEVVPRKDFTQQFSSLALMLTDEAKNWVKSRLKSFFKPILVSGK